MSMLTKAGLKPDKDAIANETMGVKICKIVCALVPLILAVFFCLSFMSLLQRADDLNKLVETDGVLPYDQCSLSQEVMAARTKMDMQAAANKIKDAFQGAQGTNSDQIKAGLEAFGDQAKAGLADAKVTAGNVADNLKNVDAQATADQLKANVQNTLDFTKNLDVNDARDTLKGAFDSTKDFFKTGGVTSSQNKGGTGWTMIYRFNTIFFLILAIQSLVLLISVCLPMLRPCVACLHCCCSQPVHLVMVILTLVYRYSDTGAECAESKMEYDNDPKRTFGEDGAELGSLAIATAICFLIFGCFTCCTTMPGALPKRD